MNKKKLRLLFTKLFARKLFQPFFRALHWVSLRGMNYGGGDSPINSGEYFFLNYIKKVSDGPVVIFDVGANIGQYALLANKIFDSKCKIYSFEPVQSTFAAFLKQTQIHDNIVGTNKGIGERAEQTEIFYNGPKSVQSSIVDTQYGEYSETIELTTIDDYCAAHGIEKIDILKLDVEGYEYKALLGGKNILKNVAFIQFEFGNKQISSRNFLKDFFTLLENFRIYRLVLDGFIEIDSNPINEIFQTSNYIAINKNAEHLTD
ncbi:MAG: FkbM family methyltransferase [Psychroserpens sp.]|nr:FkbM family methyltransferase [Psychroserpens sp.]